MYKKKRPYPYSISFHILKDSMKKYFLFWISNGYYRLFFAFRKCLLTLMKTLSTIGQTRDLRVRKKWRHKYSIGIVSFKLVKHHKFKPNMFLCNYNQGMVCADNRPLHYATDETNLKGKIHVRSFSSNPSSSLAASVLSALTSPVGNFLASFMICIQVHLSQMWEIKYKKLINLYTKVQRIEKKCNWGSK